MPINYSTLSQNYEGYESRVYSVRSIGQLSKKERRALITCTRDLLLHELDALGCQCDIDENGKIKFIYQNENFYIYDANNKYANFDICTGWWGLCELSDVEYIVRLKNAINEANKRTIATTFYDRAGSDMRIVMRSFITLYFDHTSDLRGYLTWALDGLINALNIMENGLEGRLNLLDDINKDDMEKTKITKDGIQIERGTYNLFLETLEKIGAHYEVRGRGNIDIIYQGMEFLASIYEIEHSITIYNLWFYQCALEDESLVADVKEIVNKGNFEKLVRLFYREDENRHLLGVHSAKEFIFDPELSDLDIYLRSILAKFFEAKKFVDLELESRSWKRK